MDINNQVALVTGAASGIGAAVARELAAAGAKVAILDTQREQAQTIAAEIDGLAIHCDVTQAQSAEQAINQVIQHFKRLSICINCAGIAPAARVVSRQGPMSLDDFNQVLQVNCVGTFNIIRLCAAQMMTQATLTEDGERGVIINTASVAAFDGQIGQAAYSAAKGAIVAMTLPIARELAKFGIRVITIAPGVVETPMMADMPEAVQQALQAAVPFPPRLAKAKEYASLAKEIITNAYLNATVIRLDGGLRMSAK